MHSGGLWVILENCIKGQAVCPSVSLTDCFLLAQYLLIDVKSTLKAAGLNQWDVQNRFQNKSPAVYDGN